MPTQEGLHALDVDTNTCECVLSNHAMDNSSQQEEDMCHLSCNMIIQLMKIQDHRNRLITVIKM